MTNEQRICDATAQLLSFVTGDGYSLTRKPDELNRTTNDVDAVGVSSQGNDFAIEHTSIDSFTDQRGMAASYRQFLNRLVGSLPAPLPVDRYFKLTVPLALVRSLSRKDRQTLSRLLPPWISANAPLLPEDQRVQFGFLYRGQQVLLHGGGRHPRLNGKIVPGISVPAEIEHKRRQTMSRSLGEKLPKLHRYKKSGFITVLALEDVDIALSNATAVERALRHSCFRHALRLPDYIFYFFTIDGDIAEGWILRSPRRFLQRRYYKGPYYWDETGVYLDGR